MDKIIEILMKRDGIDEEEARALVEETRDEIISLDDPMEADNIMMDYLGLEPDYILDIFCY